MVAQKHQRKLLAEFSCIFECLLTQNPTKPMLSTLLILPDYMEEYYKIQKLGPLGNYFC